MKEKYFTDSGIEGQAQDIINDIIHFRTCPDLKFKIRQSALLILDMQDYFLKENSHAFVPSGKAIINNLLKLALYFNKIGQPIIFSRHINDESNAKNMSVWWKELIREENMLSQINSSFKDITGITIVKHQYDAFYETELNQILHNKNVKNIVVTGVMSHLCVETTSRSAFIKGFGVILPADGSATYNRDLHLSSLKTLAHGFANIVLTKDIVNDS